MIVVPLEKDTIKTKDGVTATVVSYTNFKDEGPAVYCSSEDSKNQILVYFFDIEEINGTLVEYKKTTHMLESVGKIIRSQQLPQPDDEVEVNGVFVKVDSLKLKHKPVGISKGLLIKDVDGNYFRLKDVTDIKPNIGGKKFSKKTFTKSYKEYFGASD